MLKNKFFFKHKLEKTKEKIKDKVKNEYSYSSYTSPYDKHTTNIKE